MNSKIERHGEFVSKLGDRLFVKYTEGGPGIKPSKPEKEPKGKIGKGGRFARSVRRETARRGSEL